MKEVLGLGGKVTQITVSNPAYEDWVARDQCLVVYITATLSNKVLATVLDDLTAVEL